MDGGMKYFLSFMGYPRSGHTLVAAILNANPNVICSNQKNIYADVEKYNKESLEKEIFNGSMTRFFKETTQIKHVPKQEITVIGDKTGHRTVDLLGSNPQKLGIMKSLVDVPIKWIHVVRNPYDNLATWGRLNFENQCMKYHSQRKPVPKGISEENSLNDVIEKYRVLNETIKKLKRSEDVLTINHEYVITRMHNTLEEISNFLEISFDPIWRDNVRNTVWNKPRITRNDMPWKVQQKQMVADMVDRYEWLGGYDFGCGGCGKRRRK